MPEAEFGAQIKTHRLTTKAPHESWRVPSATRGRFLFVRVAAARAMQLRRGALPRIDVEADVPISAERIAIEEVQRGLVAFQVPVAGATFAQAESGWETFKSVHEIYFSGVPRHERVPAPDERNAMARVLINPASEILFAQLLQVCQQRGVILTENSVGLLRLSAEAWLQEPVPLRNGNLSTPERYRTIADQILNEALDDPHVSRRVPQRTPVPFYDMLIAISEAGSRIVRPFIEKGF